MLTFDDKKSNLLFAELMLTWLIIDRVSFFCLNVLSDLQDSFVLNLSTFSTVESDLEGYSVSLTFFIRIPEYPFSTQTFLITFTKFWLNYLYQMNSGANL